jgi:hypothetical protein
MAILQPKNNSFSGALPNGFAHNAARAPVLPVFWSLFWRGLVGFQDQTVTSLIENDNLELAQDLIADLAG